MLFNMLTVNRDSFYLKISICSKLNMLLIKIILKIPHSLIFTGYLCVPLVVQDKVNVLRLFIKPRYVIFLNILLNIGNIKIGQ